MDQKNRLPPGQFPSSDLPTLHVGTIPTLTPSTWDFRIWGAVEESLSWTWDQILALPRTTIKLDPHCVYKFRCYQASCNKTTARIYLGKITQFNLYTLAALSGLLEIHL